MRSLLSVSTFVLAFSELSSVEGWMQQAFYPALLGILVIASLGIPIPEDIPLIAAGVLLNTHPGIGTWYGTFIVAMIGIMTGDLVLYSLGRRWGPDVVNHRSVRWMITPERFTRVARRFRVHGTWFCFFGRFFVGIRAVMCMTAGATRFPYWRFFIADFAGAALSIPLFVFLGYWFADMIPTLRRYLTSAQALLVGCAAGGLFIAFHVYRVRRRAPEKARQTPVRDTAQPPVPPARRTPVCPSRAEVE